MAGTHVRVWIDPDNEAAFTVHEACHPSWIELHRRIPNVKSLRVPCAPRAFPADCPHVRLILTARTLRTSTGRLCEEIPANGSVLLGLAKTNLRTVRNCYSRHGCRGCGHFCRTLRVAAKTGLYHHDPLGSRLACSL